MAKLVRDRVPQIISPEKQHLFRFTTLTGSEYSFYLKQKLCEEVEEYLSAENIEELADIFEVLRAIIKLKEFDLNEIIKTQNEKREKNGGFENRILMEKYDCP